MPPPAHDQPPAAAIGPAIVYDRVSYRYPRQIDPAVQDVSLEVAEHERLGILGPNGGGKSTLLKLTLGLLEPTAGEIRVCGASPARARREGLVGYVPQRVQAELSFPVSALQVVAMPLFRTAQRRVLRAERRASIERALELTGAIEYASAPVGTLSGGQLQRVMIARAIACGPRILLLDEPTVGIDVAGQKRFADLLQSLHDALPLTIVIVSHDLRAIAAGCDRVACLKRTLHSHGSPAGLTPQVLAEVFSHDVEPIFGAVHVDAHTAAECPLGGEHHHEHHQGDARGEESRQ